MPDLLLMLKLKLLHILGFGEAIVRLRLLEAKLFFFGVQLSLQILHLLLEMMILFDASIVEQL